MGLSLAAPPHRLLSARMPGMGLGVGGGGEEMEGAGRGGSVGD